MSWSWRRRERALCTLRCEGPGNETGNGHQNTYILLRKPEQRVRARTVCVVYFSGTRRVGSAGSAGSAGSVGSVGSIGGVGSVGSVGSLEPGVLWPFISLFPGFF